MKNLRLVGRLATMVAVSAPLLFVSSLPASAAPPSNDGIGNATVISGVPMRDIVDLSLATWDYSTDWSSCWGTGHSVWYSFTPSSDQRVALDPSASDSAIAVDVFTGSPEALSFVGCGQGGPAGYDNDGYVLNAVAGTTYWIMASTVCCADLPRLDLAVYPAQAPQATITVNGGTVDQGGNVTVFGTVECAGNVPTGIRVTGGIRQAVGRLNSVGAMFGTTVSCSGTQQWTVLAQPSEGKFVGGPATVNASIDACNIVGCAFQQTTTVVSLRR